VRRGALSDPRRAAPRRLLPLSDVPARERSARGGVADRGEAFGWAKGEPAVYRSSPKAERLFCPNCGTQLVFRAFAEPDHLDVTLASLDNPESVRPTHHIWTASRIGWFEVADDLPRYPEGGPGIVS
jgi:hypothetical protein